MKSFDIDPSFFKPSPWVQIVGTLGAAEFHWHFSQGVKAIHAELYIPGSLSLLAGIEASIRFTLYQLKNDTFPFEDDLGSNLSNSLLRQAHVEGLPISVLAFPDEDGFNEILKKNKPGVKIVRIRNDLAHGNVQAFINRDLGDELAFFTPECLRPIAYQLQETSFAWAEALAQYRASKNIGKMR